MKRIPYLEQATLGRAGWFDFLVGGWLILVGWQVISGLLTAPLGAIGKQLGIDAADFASPEAEAEMVAAATGTALTGGLLILLSLAMVPVGYLIHRTTHGSASVVGKWIATIGVIMTVGGLLMSLPLLSAAMAGGGMDMFTATIALSPVAYGLMLFSFIGAFVAAFLVQRFVHYRTFLSLVTAAARVRWMRIVWVWLLTWGVYALTVWVSVTFMGAEISSNPERSRMVPFVIATLLFIPIQCAAEELIFRGYLNQALGRFIPSAFIVFALTSTLFGVMHLANPEVGEAASKGDFWIAAASYIVFGFIFCILVWIDNGLESAIGLHIGNNAWAAIFVNAETSVLPVPGLYIAPNPESGDIWLNLAMMGIIIAVVWFTRKPLGERAQVLTRPDLTEREDVTTTFA